MLKQTLNKVRIEGILSEVNLKTGEYEKNGAKKEYIRGDIKLRLRQRIGEKDVEMEIPIFVFSTKYTNKGTLNPAYSSALKVMEEYLSIAACGNEEDADRIRITGGEIKVNEYCGQDGTLVSYARVESSFFNKVRKDEYRPDASFNNVIVIANIKEEEGNEEEPGRLIVTGGIVQYGEKLDLVDFVVASKSAVSHINSNWEIGDTVTVNGKINYSTKTEYKTQEMDFGDPIVKPTTTSVREFIITSGSGKGMSAEDAYDKAEIKQALAARKARHDQIVAEGARKKPASTNASKVNDFGF